MHLLQNVIIIAGGALCAMALMQFAFWTTQSLSLLSQNKKQFELSRELLRKQIDNASKETPAPALTGDWSGFRTFRVAKLVKETPVCTSVYLTPDDGKPIASFQPGQHLTFKFQIPGESKPVVRCYSLSDRPNQDFYRISVKAVPPPMKQPELPAGKASNFINQTLMVGDRIEVKSPSGHFVLDEGTDSPIVLLGGGIGITPMVSIANHLIATQSNRLTLLVYGVRNAADHAFKKHFEEAAANQSNFHIVNCYSHPSPTDVEGTDFQVKGFASSDLLKQVLPNNQCQFYLCGPPPFMDSIYNGLIEWGVPENRIFFEAFGPASIGKKNKTTPDNTSTPNAGGTQVKFTSTGLDTNWTDENQTLLDLAEANEIMIDSGCRAGSCGTCETALLKGKVSYPENQSVDCEPGKCLMCIAKPDGPVELDA